MDNNSIKSYLVRGAAVIALASLMGGCAHSPSSSPVPDRQSVASACSGNVYLLKFGCSVSRIQHAAQNGNADAQYALGYMYYYGIDTAKDRQTAALWIQRAAAQGQPLAKKAWSLINSGASFTDLHRAASDNVAEASRQASTIEDQPPANVDQMNATVHNEPITTHLPAYSQVTQSQESPASTTAASNPAADTQALQASQAPQGSQDSESVENPSKKLSALSSRHLPVHDPRLLSSAKPIVATKKFA